jgi:hypothetical protein
MENEYLPYKDCSVTEGLDTHACRIVGQWGWKGHITVFFLQNLAFTLLNRGNFAIHGLLEWPGTILTVPGIWNTKKSLISLSHVTKLPAQNALSVSELRHLCLCHGAGSSNLRTPANTLHRIGSLWMGYWYRQNVSLRLSISEVKITVIFQE